MSEDTVELNTKALDQLIKAFKGKLPVARIGILGSKTPNRRSDGEANVPNNATVGLAHEFGTHTLWARSFLRMPLRDYLQKYLEKQTNLFSKETLNQVIQEGSIIKWIKLLGVAGEAVIAEAFATGGFGKWPSSKMQYKDNHQTLVETQQLRNSITSDVK